MKKEKKNLLFLGFLVVILLIVGLNHIGVLNLASIYDAGTGEARYNEILIDNTGGVELTGYQVEITVPYNPNMQSDFDDLVFTETDNTILKHHKHSYTDSATALFYVKMDVPADSIKTIRMYHGNPDASDSSDPDNVYIFYDDFSGDLSKWTVASGTWSISNGELSQTDASTAVMRLHADTLTDFTSTANVIIEGRAKHGGTNTVSGSVDIGTRADSGDYHSMNYRYETSAKKTEYRKESGFSQLAYSFNNNEYHVMKMVMHGGTTDTYIDDVIKYSNQANGLSENTYLYIADYDETSVWDWVKIRQYTANPPTSTISSLFDINGNEIIPYDIDTNNDIFIPVSLDGSASKSLYITKPDGYAPNPNLVYEFYDDFNELSQWTIEAGSPQISNGNLVLEGDAETERLITKEKFGTNFIVQYNAKWKNTGSLTLHIIQMGLKNNDNGGVILPHLRGTGTTNAQEIKKNSGDTTETISTNWATDYNYYIREIHYLTDENTIRFFENGVERTNSPYVSETHVPDDSLGIYFGKYGYGYLTCDWVKVRQYTANAPTILVTDCGDYYKVDITNNEVTALDGYQIMIDSTELDISTQTDSILISETCPITLTNEELSAENATSGNEILLNATFSNTISNAKATITLPDDSTELINLTNTENNNWSTSLTYETVGNYSITNYKFNDESETINSELSFEILAAPSTPSEPSSSGGGGGSVSVPTSDDEEVVNETEDISPDVSTVKAPITKEDLTFGLENETLFAVVFTVLIIVIYGMFKLSKK